AAVPGEGVPYWNLRSCARRRPDPLPALLLVLFAPGGLHHDPPRVRDHLGARRDVLAAAHLRLSRNCPVVGCHRVAWLLRLGAPHVRLRPVGHFERSVLAHLVPDRYSIRHQGVQLARNAISGIDLVPDPDAVRPELSVPLYDRWSDRYHGGGARARRAPSRH